MAVGVLDKHAIGEMLDGFFDAYNRHDIDGVLNYCTDDVLWEDPTAGVLRTKREVRRALSNIFRAFPDLKFAKDDRAYYMSLDGTRAASSWYLKGTMTGTLDPPGYEPTNGPIEINGVCLYELRDGLIFHHTIVFDMLELGRRMGAAPAAGSFMDKMAVRLQRMKARRKNR